MRGLLRVYIIKYQIVACSYWFSIRSCYTRTSVDVLRVSFVSSRLPSIVGEHNISERREIVYRSIEVPLVIFFDAAILIQIKIIIATEYHSSTKMIAFAFLIKTNHFEKNLCLSIFLNHSQFNRNGHQE